MELLTTADRLLETVTGMFFLQLQVSMIRSSRWDLHLMLTAPFASGHDAKSSADPDSF